MQIRKEWSAGAVLELGQGKTYIHVHDPKLGPDQWSVETDNDLYTRQSFVFMATPGGTVSIGLQSMATDDLVVPSVANTGAASKRLTAQPFGNLLNTHWFFGTLNNVELEPFNGEKADAVRYDSPVMA